MANKYRTTALGRADDAALADGQNVLSFEQAEAKGRAMVSSHQTTVHRLTVRQALARYINYKRALGHPVNDVLSRGTAHILPSLGDLVVAELTAEQLRRWLATLAASPKQTRPKAGVPQYKPAAEGDEAVRRRRASANRVLTIGNQMGPPRDQGEKGVCWKLCSARTCRLPYAFS